MSTGVGREPGKKRWSLQRGRILHRVCREIPGQGYFVYVPSAGGAEAPLLVAVHGTSRNAAELAESLSVPCEELGVVLVAPLFVGEGAKDYQRLGRLGHGDRADRALHSILEEAARLTGATATQFHLFGHSGGAQFAHRYAMAHPHRVAGAVVAAAGWYTFPDPRKRYPYGIRRPRKLPGVRFDPENFLRVPITVMVGDQDTGTKDLRSTKRVSRQQGETRLERAKRWVEAMQAAALAYRLDSRVTLEAIPGGDHSFANLMGSGRLGQRAIAALFGPSVRPLLAAPRELKRTSGTKRAAGGEHGSSR